MIDNDLKWQGQYLTTFPFYVQAITTSLKVRDFKQGHTTLQLIIMKTQRTKGSINCTK